MKGCYDPQLYYSQLLTTVYDSDWPYIVALELTDLLTDIRVIARREKNYRLADIIKFELDSRGSFCMDGPAGQIVYHMGLNWSREKLIKDIQYINDAFKFNYYENYQTRRTS